MRFYRVRKCDDKWLWRCTENNCGGTAMSTNSEDLVEVSKHHGHIPDTSLVEARNQMLRLCFDAFHHLPSCLLVKQNMDLVSEVISGYSIAHINKLFTYFEKNYVRRPNGNAALYPALLWNMCERAKAGLPRTNNNVENWNGIFNGYFIHDNPPLVNVILQLQVDEEKRDKRFTYKISILCLVS